MPKQNLTDRTLEGARTQAGGARATRCDVMDTRRRQGSVSAVSETGRRTFILVARYPGSEHPTRRSVSESTAPSTLADARDKARQMAATDRASGDDPQRR